MSSDRSQVLEDLVFTAGTTTRDGAGRDWAYLLWQADKVERLQGNSWAVYAKPGDAASPEPYARQAVVSLQTDARALAGLAHLAVSIGQNEAELESQLNSLFQARFQGSAIGLGEKLSAALRSTGEAEDRENLEFLARTHPAVALALGRAYAQPIGAGKTTFEIRQWDETLRRDLAVIGRVTITAGMPEVLPAPGAPVQVPDSTPQGHLNVRLRWGTPPLLNRFAMLQHGFNLYRVPARLAEQQHFDVQPPAPALLRYLVAVTNAAQVNLQPVLPEAELSPEEAANLDPARGGDAQTFFITDNRRRYEPGGQPFANGDQFYYFVTARDLLGRDGEVSTGTLVTICDRRPPPVPRGVSVRNEHVFEGGAAAQFLRVTWPAVQDRETGTNIVYRVYRWDNLRDLQHYGRFPATNLVGTVTPDPSCPGCPLAFADRGPGAPTTPGLTYWYTIRVEDRGACGGNLSAHSGPVAGVLRDFTTPESPSGQVMIQCGTPEARFKNTSRRPAEPEEILDSDAANYRLHCVAGSSHIEWVDWFVSFGGPKEFLGRQYFEGGITNVTFAYRIRRLNTPQLESQKFSCLVGTADGQVSSPAECELHGVLKTNETAHAYFSADYLIRRVAADTGCAHDPTPDGPPGLNLIPVDIEFELPPIKERGLLEWRLFRQVDAQPMTLIGQGTNAPINALSLRIQDSSLPVQDSVLCYYLQWVDEQGNPSRLFNLGCASVRGTSPLPVPVLATIEPAGTEAEPKMRWRWFCPPYGVERFEFRVAANAPLPASLGPELSTNLFPATSSTRTGLYRTGRVGSTLPPGPTFTLEIPVQLGTTYRVVARAISGANRAGDPSNLEDFNWYPSPEVGVNTPWPARELPAVNPGFNQEISDAAYHGGPAPLGVAALALPHTNGLSGIGVRIGEVLTVNVTTKGELYVPGETDPLEYVYRTTSGLRLAPVVLYRRQVANSRFPGVMGDLIQVSPMIERIAFQRGDYAGTRVAFLRDPFLTILPATELRGRPQLILRDTQPVVGGARYKYFLMLFKANGEPDQIIPTNDIELPSQETTP